MGGWSSDEVRPYGRRGVATSNFTHRGFNIASSAIASARVLKCVDPIARHDLISVCVALLGLRSSQISTSTSPQATVTSTIPSIVTVSLAPYCSLKLQNRSPGSRSLCCGQTKLLSGQWQRISTLPLVPSRRRAFSTAIPPPI
jgi:hypothetical protein